ncbi:MAG: hypothetical protein JNN15_13225 [Blastocatellia bacterium]|nr:hypothetical protein [Blastocatellia bacterium]
MAKVDRLLTISLSVLNAQRQGKEQIPEIGIRGTLKKLETPSMIEGFDELFYVNLLPKGVFNVVRVSSEI